MFRIAQRGAAPLTTAQVVKLVQPSVVAVSVTTFRSDPREGTGFVYGAVGRILTSARLLSRALSVSVMDSTGVTYSASVIGLDRPTGVAELEMNSLRAKPIKPAQGAAVVGTKVLVIDNPDGFLTHDVTQGAVSDTGGTLTFGSTTYQNLLKTGAGSTAGDTGGPLVNASGQLVGMVTTDPTGHAFAIPVASFKDDAKTWALSATPLDLGPPNVTATPQSLVLPTIGPGWSRTENKQFDSTTWHSLWEKPANYTYGGEGVDIYLGVEPDVASAVSQVQTDEDYVKSNGFALVGPIAGMGDEAAAYQRVVDGRPTFAVIWRDRNSDGLVYFGSGRPPAPEVSLATTEGIAFAQEAVMGADLANYQ